MTAYAQIEASQAIAAKRIGAALQYNATGTIALDARFDDRSEHVSVGVVVDAVAQGNVDRIVSTGVLTDFVHRSGARKKIVPVLVKRNGHDAIGEIEGLLNAVAVVNVDVDVENARVPFQEFENGDDDVVHVAESGRFVLLRVVKSARPIDGDVRRVGVQFHGAVERTARRNGAEVEKTGEYGTIFADVEFRQRVGVGVLRRDATKKANVVGRVKVSHVVFGGAIRSIDGHFLVETVVENETVRQREPMGLHRVTGTVVEVADVRIVKVGDATRRRRRRRHSASLLGSFVRVPDANTYLFIYFRFYLSSTSAMQAIRKIVSFHNPELLRYFR